ncbi:MAG TPA: DUF222 domain-containing protein [Mycobacterium sp.]|nr:DUF222 domain-containing protein [Mycobacterium sp.]
MPHCARCLASGKLGVDNGLPTTIIVTTTLRELESGAGRAVTGGGFVAKSKRCSGQSVTGKPTGSTGSTTQRVLRYHEYPGAAA